MAGVCANRVHGSNRAWEKRMRPCRAAMLRAGALWILWVHFLRFRMGNWTQVLGTGPSWKGPMATTSSKERQDSSVGDCFFLRVEPAGGPKLGRHLSTNSADSEGTFQASTARRSCWNSWCPGRDRLGARASNQGGLFVLWLRHGFSHFGERRLLRSAAIPPGGLTEASCFGGLASMVFLSS